MVRWTVVSPTHRGSNPGARIIPVFISGFPAMHFQREETFPSTTRRLRWVRKSQNDMSAQSLGGAHRGRVCVYAFIGVSVCVCIWALLSVLMLKKETVPLQKMLIYKCNSKPPYTTLIEFISCPVIKCLYRKIKQCCGKHQHNLICAAYWHSSINLYANKS